MSGYEDYDDTSKNYDKTRRAIGVEIIVGCFASGPQRLDQMLVLDAGCGTGSYSEALLPHVLRVEAIDSNGAMVEEASRKLKNEIHRERVSVQTAEIGNLPFDDGYFDGIMVNQVLHHLADDADAGYPLHRHALAEFRRVLKPGGVLVVNTSSQEQLLHGFWYYDLIPRAAEEIGLRFAPLDFLSKTLVESDFTYRGSIVPTSAVLQGESYFDARGPLSKHWRDGDSSWALAREEEIEEVLARVALMDQEGDLADYLARSDKRRPEIGQVTFLHASRS